MGRAGIVLPSWGMMGAFLMGLAIAVWWGMSFAATGADWASGFFDSLGDLFLNPIGLILMALLILATIKLWYFFVPFWVGVLAGLGIVLFFSGDLQGGFASGSTITFLYSHGGMKDEKDIAIGRHRDS